MTSTAEPEAALAVGGRGPVRIGPLALTLPSLFGMLFFFAAPLVAFAIYSFLTAGLYSVSRPLTLDGYREAVSSDVNGTLAMNSFVVGICAAAVTVAIGLADRLLAALRSAGAGSCSCSSSSRRAVRELPRAHLRLALDPRRERPAQLRAEALGLIDEPLGFLLYNRFAVTVALVHIFLPYVVLVLFAGFRPSPGACSSPRRTSARTRSQRWRQSHPAADRRARRHGLPLRLRALRRRLRDAPVPRRQERRDAGGADPGQLHRRRQLAARRRPLVPDAAAFVVCYVLVSLGLRLLRLNRIRFVG